MDVKITKNAKKPEVKPDQVWCSLRQRSLYIIDSVPIDVDTRGVGMAGLAQYYVAYTTVSDLSECCRKAEEWTALHSDGTPRYVHLTPLNFNPFLKDDMAAEIWTKAINRAEEMIGNFRCLADDYPLRLQRICWVLNRWIKEISSAHEKDRLKLADEVAQA